MGYYLGAAQTWAQLRPGGLTTGYGVCLAHAGTLLGACLVHCIERSEC